MVSMTHLYIVGVISAVALAKKPHQVHLSHGGDETSMTIGWLSDKTYGSVYYGTGSDPSKFKEVKSEGADQYSFVNGYVPDYKYTSDYIHFVTLTGLAANTMYNYRVGTDDDYTMTYMFTTAPAVGADAGKMMFAIMGDLGQTNNSNATLQQVVKEKIMTGIRSSIIVGDLSYADSAHDPKDKPCNQTRWDSWGEMVEPLAAWAPLMVLPGNHEEEVGGPPPATQEPFLAYQKRFRMPAPQCGAIEGNLYYSYNVGSVHFIMMNAFGNYNSTSKQYAWFKKDIDTIDRSVTPWVIVAMHAPCYNSNTHHHDEPEEIGMKATYEDMFLKLGVDAIFAGHVHAYERTKNIAHNKTDTANGIVYINVGDGGNREGHTGGFYPMPEWSAFREDQFGHGILTVYNSTNMEWQWRSIADPTAVGDHVDFIKKASLGMEMEGSVAVAHGRNPHVYLQSQEQHDAFAWMHE